MYAYLKRNGERNAIEEWTTSDGNDNPQGIWGNAEAIWISDPDDSKLYAYDRSTKARRSSHDITLDSDNSDARGVWGQADQDLIWVLDQEDNKIYPYTISTRTLNTSKTKITLSSNQAAAFGIWGNSDTVWVSDEDDQRLQAYETDGTGARAALDTALHPAGVSDAYGVWSDGEHIWTASDDDKLYARNLHSMRQEGQDIDLSQDRTELIGIHWRPDTSTMTAHQTSYIWQSQDAWTWTLDQATAKITGTHATINEREIVLDAQNTAPTGLWSDGVNIYTADRADDEIYAYQLTSTQRQTDKEWNLDSANGWPRGLWSDGTYVWVSDANSVHLFAYQLAGGLRQQYLDIDLHPDSSRPRGVTGAGNLIWTADSADTKAYAYRIPNRPAELSGPTLVTLTHQTEHGDEVADIDATNPDGDTLHFSILRPGNHAVPDESRNGRDHCTLARNKASSRHTDHPGGPGQRPETSRRTAARSGTPRRHHDRYSSHRRHRARVHRRRDHLGGGGEL